MVRVSKYLSIKALELAEQVFCLIFVIKSWSQLLKHMPAPRLLADWNSNLDSGWTNSSCTSCGRQVVFVTTRRDQHLFYLSLPQDSFEPMRSSLTRSRQHGEASARFQHLMLVSAHHLVIFDSVIILVCLPLRCSLVICFGHKAVQKFGWL